ncbi:MAG: F0F1 ATP synthase subunit delta [Candidatus Omnitrophica bacterium]|nr:F0F1 ATP synthase subunit delta [Candidatus Omnitrophota bacterium]
MMILMMIIVLQLFVAGIVIFILKRLLDRELEKEAFEKLMSLKTDSAVDLITVYYAQTLSVKVQQEFTAVVKNKFVNGKIVWENLGHLKGGLIIKVNEEVFDFSLSSRLENFWS